MGKSEKRRRTMQKLIVLACLAAVAEAYVSTPVLGSRSKLSMSKVSATPPKMSLDVMDVSSVEQLSTTLAGVVAVDGGTVGLNVTFGAFLAVILGLFIPVVFLVTLYIQSDAQGTAVTFRQPDSIGGTLFEDESTRALAVESVGPLCVHRTVHGVVRHR